MRCGYAWCRIGAAWLRACAPARASVSSVPVPDADTLDMKKRAYMRASCGGGHARYVQSGGGYRGVASLLQRSIRLEKFLLKTKTLSE